MKGHIRDNLYSYDIRSVLIPYKWWHEYISDYKLSSIWCASRPQVHAIYVIVEKLCFIL
jgi:hypothetical protein